MLLVTAVTVSPTAGTTTMADDDYYAYGDDYRATTTVMDDDYYAGVDDYSGSTNEPVSLDTNTSSVAPKPKDSALLDTNTSTTSYYGLLALLPLFAIAAAAGAAYYIDYR